MTLRSVNIFNSIPHSWPVSPSSEFEPGMLLGLTVENNMVVATNSNGLSVIGIVDDIKTKAFSANSWDETVIVQATGVPDPNNNNILVTPVDIKTELNNPNISANSFISIPVSVILKPRNGVITFPAGTPLNFNLTGGPYMDSIKTIVRYSYLIPNIPGDDSTQSGRCSVWVSRCIMQTDKFETNQVYPLNCNLFPSEIGLLTSRAFSPDAPAVAICTSPPNALMPFLEFLWL